MSSFIVWWDCNLKVTLVPGVETPHFNYGYWAVEVVKSLEKVHGVTPLSLFFFSGEKWLTDAHRLFCPCVRVFIRNTLLHSRAHSRFSTPVFTRRRVENINWRQSISTSSADSPLSPLCSAGLGRELRLRKAGFPLRKCCSSPLSVNTGKETPRKKQEQKKKLAPDSVFPL